MPEMRIEVLKSKLHRVTVTAADLEYEGSLSLDTDLMAAAGLFESEKVAVANLRNGERFETYLIRGEKGSGEVMVNGAAARLASPGDELIVMAYGHIGIEQAEKHRPKVVLVDKENRILKSDGKPRKSVASSAGDWI